MSRTFHRNAWVAYAATVALILCGALYAAHGLGDRAHEHEHCDLCVHLGGSAASPAQAQVIGKAVLVARVHAVPAGVVLVSRSPLGPHLPRGPPRQATLS